MRKGSNPTSDYFKLVLFVVFLAESVLFLLAIIFGRILGYVLTMIACFWLGIILAACFGFALIVLGIVLPIAGTKLIRLIQRTSVLAGLAGSIPLCPFFPSCTAHITYTDISRPDPRLSRLIFSRASWF
jgi:hypothetical protein